MRWYTLRLALSGPTPKQADQVVADFIEEFGFRPHFENPAVSWDQAGQRVMIQVDLEGSDPASTAAGAAEEVLELSAAYISGVKRVSVDIIDVTLR